MRLLLLLFLTTILASGAPDHRTDNGALRLLIGNVQKNEGWIWVGIYDSEENFLVKEKAIVQGMVVYDTGTLEMTVDQVKYGDCAVAVFHDINGNGNLDRNWLGIPIEPYAFSRKPASKWRLPRFREVLFDFQPEHSELMVVLDRW